MSHPLVIGVFEEPRGAAAAARAVHGLGVSAERLSVVAANHEQEGLLAREMDGTPGADMEDSRTAGRLAELGARVIAAVALVLPGVGPILAAGPLAAGLGEAAGHVAGGLAAVLRNAGVDEAVATAWESKIEQGAVLLGVHVVGQDPAAVQAALEQAGARETALATWPED